MTKIKFEDEIQVKVHFIFNVFWNTFYIFLKTTNTAIDQQIWHFLVSASDFSEKNFSYFSDFRIYSQSPFLLSKVLI